VCLISALDWHDLTLQMPHRIQIALPKGAEEPRITWPPVETFRFSGDALTFGVETHPIDEVPVRIYGPEKTVADCFKFRNRIGPDVALEALKFCWERRRCNMDKLWEAAGVCRVRTVMRPYLEAVTS
jgi:predicted transcriptional regulator of viral defense system